MNTNKALLTATVAVLVCTGMLTVIDDSDESSAVTLDGKCGDDLKWTFIKGKLTITGSGDMYDYLFNSSPWYSQRSMITSLSLPDGLTHIGNNAFEECSKITGTLKIPESVTSVGNYSFTYCSGLSGTLRIPDSVTTIGDGAFSDCPKFTKLIIGTGVTTIGDWGFSDCIGLTSITIPDNVTKFGGLFGSFGGLSFFAEDGTTALKDSANYMAGYTFTGTYSKMIRGPISLDASDEGDDDINLLYVAIGIAAILLFVVRRD